MKGDYNMIKISAIKRKYTGATLDMFKVSVKKEIELMRKEHKNVVSGAFTKKMIEKGLADSNYAITLSDLKKVMNL